MKNQYIECNVRHSGSISDMARIDLATGKIEGVTEESFDVYYKHLSVAYKGKNGTEITGAIEEDNDGNLELDTAAKLCLWSNYSDKTVPVFVNIEESNGEFEYNMSLLSMKPDVVNLDSWADYLASVHYGEGNADSVSAGFAEYNNGCVASFFCDEISAEDAAVLSRYL